MMNDAAISIEDLTCRYGRTVAVDRLSLKVPKGKIFGFLGENGAGKTTTIQTIMGLIRPASGTIRVLGADPVGGNPALLERIGYVSEDRAMYRWMKVPEVLRFNEGLYESWDSEYAITLIRELELDPYKKVKQLSRGQLAKLALLCALAQRPELLVLDEASSGLDAVVRRTILERLIDASSERGITIFLSTHLVEEVDRMADEIAILCRGRLIVKGERDAIKSSLASVLIPSDKPIPFEELEKLDVLNIRNGTNEQTLILRNLNDDKISRLRELSGSEPEIGTLTLEDVFAEYTQCAKKNPKALREVAQ